MTGDVVLDVTRPYTIGVEEEFQVVDPRGGGLISLPPVAPGQPPDTTREGVVIKRELHRCAVEVDTGICADVAEVERRVAARRSVLFRWGRERGLDFLAASAHPSDDWRGVPITASSRYDELVEALGEVVRANLIFGLHVHIGVPDRSRALQIMSRVASFLPHLLALSCSSPFWRGRDTGYRSSRSLVFSRIPRTGIPPVFADLSSYQSYLQRLVTTGCVRDATRIWWDLRPHPSFPTLEFRICDIPPRMVDVVTLTALCQALVVSLDRSLDTGRAPEPTMTALVDENKWRAARDGVRARLVDFDHDLELCEGGFVEQLLELVDPVLDELCSRAQAERALLIRAQGTSADRQLQSYEQGGRQFAPVIDQLRRETREGVS